MPETKVLEVQLFPATRAAIPWEELAFPVNHWTLRDFLSLDGGDVLRHLQQRQKIC